MREPEVVTPALLRDWTLPDPGSSKHARGAVLVVAGSRETPGVAVLCAEAALRVGAGKVQVATTRSTATQVGLAVPESLVRGLPETEGGDLAQEAGDAVGQMAQGPGATLLGSGMLDPDAAVALLEEVVPRCHETVVIDALGSAYVGQHRDGLGHLGGRCVLTLNPKELARTADVDPEVVEADPVKVARDLAAEVGAVVLCGGQQKIVAAPDGVAYRVSGGGPGLGVSGSGDVQAGLVAGLLARGADPVQAAVWGGHLHAAAGDQLAQTVGQLGYLARELPAVVPGLLTALRE